MHIHTDNDIINAVTEALETRRLDGIERATSALHGLLMNPRTKYTYAKLVAAASEVIEELAYYEDDQG